MAFILAKDAISGKEGVVTANIDGSVRELAEIKSLTATITKTKNDFRSLGYRGTQHKTTGWNGTGSVTFYYVTSEWTRQMVDYVKTGKDLYFDIVLTNEDPGSAIGTQRIKLAQCNLDNLDIAKIDVDANWLEATFAFTFSDVDLLDSFVPALQ